MADGPHDHPPGSDAVLVARIVARDENAFALAYDRYADLLFGTLVRFSGDRETAAEVVQDTFMALWLRAPQFNERLGSLAGWLLGIARNRAVDRHRSEARRPIAGPLAPDGQTTARHQSSNSEGDPATITDRRWLQAVVRTAVSELPDEERDVVLLAYSQELSQSEISSHTGLPLGTVKSRTRRALAHLRTRLALLPGVPETGPMEY